MKKSDSKIPCQFLFNFEINKSKAVKRGKTEIDFIVIQ